MSDLPDNQLLQQMKAHPRSGEELELLGKRAAACWERGETKTLTEAVVQTVKQAQLSPEQVKRVVEFTNTSAFLNQFNKEGSTHKVIEFEGGPADASDILKDLNDGGGGSVFDRGTLDYASPPSETKTASVQEESALANLFGASQASAPLPYENPHGEVIELRDKIAGAMDHLHAQMSGLEVMYAELGDRVYHQVKQASLFGHSLGDILHAWEAVAPADDYIKVAFSLITPRLLKDEVFWDVPSMHASVDKTASTGMVNREHPLVADFSEFCTVLQKLAETRVAREELRTHLEHLNEYIKAAASMVGKVTGAARGLAEKATPFLHEAVGPTAGNIAAKGIQFSPHMLGLLGLSELNTHVENSPSLPASAARAVKHTVMQNIPGTAANYQHKWQVQSGQ
jgi:hypothetical protein